MLFEFLFTFITDEMKLIDVTKVFSILYLIQNGELLGSFIHTHTCIMHSLTIMAVIQISL